jgi:drug/metabolite transporter (DMT)-like permease
MTQISQLRKSFTQPGVLAAMGAALLFGSSTPLAKLLLAGVSPWLMAALLYLGSGIGLTLYRVVRRERSVRPRREELPWLAAEFSLMECSVQACRCWG